MLFASVVLVRKKEHPGEGLLLLKTDSYSDQNMKEMNFFVLYDYAHTDFSSRVR